MTDPCQEEYDGNRCEFPNGHVGPHYAESGGNCFRWSRESGELAQRIIRDLAKREEIVAAKIKDVEILIAREKYIVCHDALHRALEANGQCGWCEKPKAECKGHVASAVADDVNVNA